MLFVDKMDTIAIRNTVNTLIESYAGYCVVFSGDETSGYQFVAGSKNKDCNELAKTLRTELGAKGGGAPSMIQGSVIAAREKISAILKE